MLADLLLQTIDSPVPALALALALVAISSGTSIAVCILVARRIRTIAERGAGAQLEPVEPERSTTAPQPD